MTKDIFSKWIDLVLKKETQIISMRHWLEFKFQSIIAIEITLLSIAPSILKDKFFVYDSFQRATFYSVLLLFLALFWLYLIFSYLYDTPSQYLERIKDLTSKKIEYFIEILITFIFGIFHLCVFGYFNAIGLKGYLIFLPIGGILLVGVGMTWFLFSSEFELGCLKRQNRSNLSKKIVFLGVGFNLMVIFYYYALLSIAQKTAFASDLKCAVLIGAFFYLITLGISTWKIKDNLPDLSNFEFELLSKGFKNEDEIIDRYEELMLGKNALRWVKDKSIDLNRMFDHIEKDVSELGKNIQNVANLDLTPKNCATCKFVTGMVG